MGADNVIEIDVARRDGAVAFSAGPHHDGVRLPCARDLDEPGVHVAGRVDGPAVAHFRSEAASLTHGQAGASEQLLLRGRIAQSAYPGGFYRYAVDVGAQRFMVDHAERLAVGEQVGIRLPASALHLYPRG
jgi:ABC-type Fe3+/spermidine/putrescine transport system ATPase subunit